MIEAVRAHALAHYEIGGWDYVIECFDDDEIAEVIEGATTSEEAIRLKGRHVGVKDNYRKEIESTAW